jgi:hypothetical protein
MFHYSKEQGEPYIPSFLARAKVSPQRVGCQKPFPQPQVAEASLHARMFERSGTLVIKGRGVRRGGKEAEKL